MQRSCQQCDTGFEITTEDREFLERVAPTVGGQKCEIPPPTLCPECRQQRRYACRNDRNYYTGSCTQCQKPLITSYSPDKHIPILCDTCFFGDKWDPLSYGKEFDFSKPFFEQFKVLRDTVPRLGIYHTQSENSDYTVHSSRNRNCYMGSSIVDCEDVHFSDFSFVSENSMDLFSCSKMELCYECIFCEDSYHCDHCENCTNCNDCSFCFDCRGSENLLGCIGLRKQRNKILNQNATKEEFKKTSDRLRSDPAFRADFEEKFHALKLKHPHPATWMVNAENCSGNYIWNSKNAQYSYNVKLAEDTRFVYEVNAHTTTMDCCRIGNGELLYECASIVDLKYSAFCNLTYQSDQLLYCDNCTGTSQCFGSFGLKKHKHCIFNKQYSKKEYEELVPKIVYHMRTTNEWGEFFPVATSVFGYNESKAHEWYPLDENAVKKNGWKWSNYELPMPGSVKTITADQLPSNISDIPDDILNWAIVCEVSGRPFKIIKQELQFYRQNELPIPRRSPKQRHYDRIRPVNIRTLDDRTCGKCAMPIRTIYSAQRPEIVYCEECYLKEVY
jgi:hypothetical protein